MTPNDIFSPEERRGVYRAIHERRDVRSQFLPEAVLDRILEAAHHAPSVGFMQPWDFIVIRDSSIRQAVYGNFARARHLQAEQFHGEKRELHDRLKLAGIMD